MNHVLVVYFSRTGHTRVLAEGIARALGADLEEIRDRTDRTGLLGWLRSGAETVHCAITVQICKRAAVNAP